MLARLGPSTASGKAAIAPALAASLGCPHLNANWLLSAENHARLEQGQPLVDVDRIAWVRCPLSLPGGRRRLVAARDGD